MKTTTFSSRAFNQHINEAKRATEDGPVFVTNRGKPQHVLLKVEDYQRLQSRPRSMAQLLGIQTRSGEPPELPLRTAQIKSKPPQFD